MIVARLMGGNRGQPARTGGDLGVFIVNVLLNRAPPEDDTSLVVYADMRWG